jgi:mannose-6-phosphate isomerase-like protein (cupin superfamily)
MNKLPSACDEERASHWRVVRVDDNGNHFVVAAGLTREEAAARVTEMESHGHKQAYWFLPEGAGRRG